MKNSNRLVGCLLGCLTTLLVVIAVAIALYFWIKAPGPQIATETVVGEESAAVFHLSGLGSDEGVTELLIELTQRLQQSQLDAMERSDVPPPVQWMSQILFRFRSDPERLKKQLPRDVTTTIEYLGADSGPSPLVAANFPSFPRLVRMIAWGLGVFGETESYKGATVQSLDEAGYLSFRENTLLWSPANAGVFRALDRTAGPMSVRAGGVIETVERLKSESDFCILMTRQETITWLRRLFVETLDDDATARVLLRDPAWDNVTRLELTMDIVRADLGVTNLRLEASDLASRGTIRTQLDLLVAELKERALESSVDWAFEVREEGDQFLEIDAEIRNLADAIGGQVERNVR